MGDLKISVVIFLTLVNIVVSTPGSEEYLLGDSTDMTRDELVIHYFHLGFEYLEILALLLTVHGITLSLSQLKRLLKRNRLRRRKDKSSDQDVRSAIVEELCHSGRYLGYRAMCNKLRKKHGLTVDRESVRLLLTELDPNGVANRRRHRLTRRNYRVKGVNYIWHIDGWDKLNPYGLAVHGAIDGFSRRIMWLEVSPTNKNPEVVASFFMNSVGTVGALPCMVRADCGTENGNIEIIQTALCNLEGADMTTFLYGKSTANQRIESWWSKFRQMGMEHWLDHFRNMLSTGIIDNSNECHIECIRYCYMSILRKELSDIRVLWNTHYIRASRGEDTPHGKPDIMFRFPELYDTQDYSKPYDNDLFNAIGGVLTSQTPDCKPHYKELFEILLQEDGRTAPSDMLEAADTLVYLLDQFS